MSETKTKSLREAFGAFTTGVTVVTTTDPEGKPRGFTANSFTSVSLSPPMLLVCIAKESRSLTTFTAAPGFAVNVLADHQQGISNAFSRPGADRFSKTHWHVGPHGAPILEEVAAWFDCSRSQVIDAGDHVILLGEVKAYGSSGRRGLAFGRGGYISQTLSDSAITAAKAPHVLVGAIIAGDGGVLLRRSEHGLTLPRIEMTEGQGSVRALDRLAGQLGLIASFGFVFAVYEDTGTQHIVYRCEAQDQAPQRGRFYDPARLDPEKIYPPDRRMLARFHEEREAGCFGVYFGDAKRGEVRQLSEGPPGRL